MQFRRLISTGLVALLLSSGGCATNDAEHAGGDRDGASGSAGESATGAPPTEPGAGSSVEPAPAEARLPDWRKMWDFNDGAATEQRFVDAIDAGEKAGDTEYVLIVTTQLARSQGLQRKFDQAHATLDDVEARMDGASPEVRMRYRLERGRAFNSAGSPEESVPLFEEAWGIGAESGEDLLAIDAAHMLAIALPGGEQLPWSEKAIALAESSEDPRCKGWLGPLYNNTGWTYHDLGEFEKALALWEKSLAFRQEQGAVEEVFIARWAIARCWRSMGRYQDALAEQKSILDDRVAADRPSEGYCEEEIGENLYALGRKDEARVWFGQAWDLLHDDGWMQADEAERLARMKELGGR